MTHGDWPNMNLDTTVRILAPPKYLDRKALGTTSSSLDHWDGRGVPPPAGPMLSGCRPTVKVNA